MTTNTNSAHERTASIDLAQLDRNQVLELMLKYDLLTQIGYRALLDGDSMDADLNFLTRLVEIARRSLTSGAPAEPVAQVYLDNDCWLDINASEIPGWEVRKFKTRILYASPVHDAAAPSTGQANCGSYACKAAQRDGIICAEGECDIENGVRSAGATAKTEQAPEHETIVQEGGNLVCTACGTTAEIAAVEFDSNMQKVDIATAAGAGSAQPRDVCAEMRALCSSCGGTGDVHSFDGEWRGECNCPAGIALALDRLKIAAAKTQRENEELRATLARAPLPAQGCRWPTCESEKVQQEVAGQAYRELYSGERAQPVDDARDAERYRWLRARENNLDAVVDGDTMLFGESLDHAIDTEIAALRANDGAAEGGK